MIEFEVDSKRVSVMSVDKRRDWREHAQPNASAHHLLPVASKSLKDDGYIHKCIQFKQHFIGVL